MPPDEPVKPKELDAPLKSRYVGVNVQPDLLGVARYVVPGWKPLWLQAPVALLSTDAGMAPVPDTRVKVTVTPEWSDWPESVTDPDTANCAGA